MKPPEQEEEEEARNGPERPVRGGARPARGLRREGVGRGTGSKDRAKGPGGVTAAGTGHHAAATKPT